MAIICTGAAGFIGSNIFNKLTKYLDIVGCDNLSFGKEKNVEHWGNNSFLTCDFNDLHNTDLNSCDILIHCATSNIIYAQNYPTETFINNALNTIKLFKRFKGRIIYLSTSSIYNNASIIPTPETQEPHCVNAYDTSKLIAQLFLRERGNYTTLILNNTYGKNQRPDSPYSGVLGKFIDCAIKDKPMTIYGDGESTRSYTYVNDVVDAVIKTINLPSLDTEINIGSSVEISVNELCKLVWKAVDKPMKYERASERKIDGIKRRALDCRKAKELLGWEAKTSIEDGVKRTIEWQQSCV